MKRIFALGALCVAAFAAIGATCIVTNESLTSIEGHDTFAGELQNDSGVDILQHRYRVAFLNENGAVVESHTVDGCLRSLQDGESDFFAATSALPDETTEVALARLANFSEDPDFTIGTVEPGGVVVNDVTAEREGGTLTVEGSITNEDEDELEEPVACVVVRDEDGNVVTVAKETGLADLAENESADFSLEIAVPDDADLVDSVDVWADGLEDDVPVEPDSFLDVALTVIATATPTATATGTPTATATATPTATAAP